MTAMEITIDPIEDRILPLQDEKHKIESLIWLVYMRDRLPRGTEIHTIEEPHPTKGFSAIRVYWGGEDVTVVVAEFLSMAMLDDNSIYIRPPMFDGENLVGSNTSRAGVIPVNLSLCLWGNEHEYKHIHQIDSMEENNVAKR